MSGAHLHRNPANSLEEAKRRFLKSNTLARSLPMPNCSDCELYKGVLYTFGLKFTKYLFNLLYHESKIKQKPIVYLVHPAEFAHKSMKRSKKFSMKVEGVKFRRNPFIFESDIEKRYQLHVELFEYISSRPNIDYMTMQDYEKKLRNKNG